MSDEKCSGCDGYFRKMKNKKKRKISNDEEIGYFQNNFNKTLSIGDIICEICRWSCVNYFSQLPKVEGSSESEEIPSSQQSSQQSSSSFSQELPKKVTEPEPEPIEYVWWDIDCCAATESRCFVCKSDGESARSRIPFETRVSAFLKNKLYIPRDNRCCPEHILNNVVYEDCLGNVKRISKESRIPSDDFKKIFEAISMKANNPTVIKKFKDSSISDQECYTLTGLTFAQLKDLNNKLRSLRSSHNRTPIEALAVFLCKLRTNMSHQLLSVVFGIKNFQTVAHYLDSVESAMITDFVPSALGPEGITREHLLRNKTSIASKLFSEDKAIIIADGTYAYHQKSSNNLYQRKSYSGQKHRHLCKPFTVSVPNGLVLEMFGPFEANWNDAQILEWILDNEKWFTDLLRPGDIFILDRGFRDVKKKLEDLGFKVFMPAFKDPKKKQLSTQDANLSRMVTKVRWTIEVVHGDLKQRYRYLDGVIQNKSLSKVKNYFRIAAALHNVYGSRLNSDVGKNFF